MTNEEAVEVLTLANRSHTGEGAENAPGNSERGSSHRTNVQRLTAFELLEREQRTTRITTCCSQLDQLLNGGFCSGEITEICELCAQVGNFQSARRWNEEEYDDSGDATSRLRQVECRGVEKLNSQFRPAQMSRSLARLVE